MGGWVYFFALKLVLFWTGEMDLDIGYNILDFWGVRSQVLSLGIVAAVSQLPFLPVEYSPVADGLPTYKKKALSLIGGGASYGYLGSSFAAVVDGGLALNRDDESQMGYQRLMLDFYPVGRLSIELGGFNRFTQGRRCASKADACLLHGKVATTSQERGAFLGLGLVFQ